MGQRKTEYLSLRLEPKLKRAVEQAAAADQRSLSNLIAVLAANYCREIGYLTEDNRGDHK
jgi:hypothetical protein